ncbi:MAG: spore cortex biosynthesis protein YabQ [Caldanaerobacter sp.]|uniref:spore cortex biosynthesis protein YabQ n=1 Tax=Caldanaerobacter sp. TaxID=2930036 RepID=UPI003C78CC21
MVITIQSQIYSFLVTVYGGFILGALYDFFRVVQKILRLKRGLVTAVDIIFWLISTGVILYFLYMSNYIDLRFYNFLGFLLGFLLYYFLLSDFITEIFTKIMTGIILFFRFAAEILFKPFVAVICFFKRPFDFIKNLIKEEFKYFKIFKGKK